MKIKEKSKIAFNLPTIAILLACIGLIFTIISVVSYTKNEKLLLDKIKIQKELKKLEALQKEKYEILKKINESSSHIKLQYLTDLLPATMLTSKVEAKEIKKLILSDNSNIVVSELVIDEFDLANLMKLMENIRKFYPAVSIREISILSSSQKPGFAKLSISFNVIENQ